MLRPPPPRAPVLPRVVGVAAPLLLALLGVGPCERRVIEIGLPTLAGALPVQIELASRAGIRSCRRDRLARWRRRDGPRSAAGGAGLVGSVPIPAAGPAPDLVSRPVTLLPGISIPLTNGPELPCARGGARTAVRGAAGRRQRACRARRGCVSAWRHRSRDGALDGFGFALECNGESVARRAHALGDGTLILNPTPELPAGASCRVVWRGERRQRRREPLRGRSQRGRRDAVALYDRSDPLALAPFPDDYYVVADAGASRAACDRHAGRRPSRRRSRRRPSQRWLRRPTASDGWSRMTHDRVRVLASARCLGIARGRSRVAGSVRADRADRRRPREPAFGDRIPYRILLRNDEAPDGSFDHTALLFPSIDLREHGRYAVVVTQRAFAAGEPGRPRVRPPSSRAVLAAPGDGEAPEVTQARDKIEPALATVAALAEVPIPAEDIAVAVQLSIRTQPGVEDSVYFKERALSLPPPELVLPTLANPCPNATGFCIRLVPTRALEIRGRVRLPEYRNPGSAGPRARRERGSRPDRQQRSAVHDDAAGGGARRPGSDRDVPARQPGSSDRGDARQRHRLSRRRGLRRRWHPGHAEPPDRTRTSQCKSP